MKRIGLLLLISIIFFSFFSSQQDNNYQVAEEDLISKQEKQDEFILKYLKDGYSLDNPKIIINPYYISPLTALIIFNTSSNIDLEIFLNDEEYQAIKNEKEFIIPIIYLKENYNNKITLKTSDNEYIYYLQTDKLVKTNVNIKSKENKNYLVSSPNSDIRHSLFDAKGNLIWYLNLDASDFIETYDDESFLIGVEETSEDANVSTQKGIYIIDYLGKIIKRIDTKYNYHHELILNDDDVYLLGTKGNIPMNLIYKMNLSNGRILDEIDIYELLIKENKEIKPYLDTLKSGMFINSIDYLDDNLLISIRNLNTIMSINMKNKNINWIISNSEEIKSKFPKYIKKTDIKLLGNHHAKFINENTISVYNNGYDYSNEHKNTNAAGIILDITKEKAATKLSYPIDEYSYAYGSMEVGKTALINYSYLLKNFKKDPRDITNTYSEIIEYKKNKIITKIKIDAPIYRAKIFDIKKDKKYRLKKYTYLSNYDDLKVDITNSKSINNILKISNNSMETLISDDAYQELIVVFKGKKQYNIKYQKSKTYFSIEDGIYDLFISMDNKWYKLDSKVKIGD